MYIYLTASTALLIAISASQAFAQSLSLAGADAASFQNRPHRGADHQIRQYASVVANHALYRAQRVPGTSTEALPTTTTTQSHTPSILNPAIMNHELYHAGAATEPSTTSQSVVSATTPSIKSPTLDSANWNSQTKAACEAALRNLNGKASNPAGVAVCYNLPGLDSSTGAFQVDLRLYRVAAPAQGWKAVFDQTVSVALYYPGATVASQDTDKWRRDVRPAVWDPVKSVKAVDLGRRTNDANLPQILQAFHLIGQINADMMGEMTNR